MKKIAYIGIKGLPSRAGVDRVVEAIVTRIDRGAFQPTVYCSSMEPINESLFPGVRLLKVPVLPGKHLHATSLFLFAALHALFVGDYHLVHVHNVEAGYVLPLLRLRYKVISTSHGAAQARDKWGLPAKWLIGLMELPFIYLSNCVTSVSKPLAYYYKRRYRWPVHYLPNGVTDKHSVDLASAHMLLNQYGIVPGDFLLFAAGRIMATKGCHLVLEAFRDLSTTTRLVIVGDMSHNPSYEQELRKLANERVCFIPFVDNPAILFGLVQSARLFVFPSLVEAMSMMLLEAAMLGTPLISSDIPENTSVLPTSALCFRSGNAADLREKIIWALEHPEQMRRRARLIQEWVREKYHWDEIIKGYERLYATI